MTSIAHNASAFGGAAICISVCIEEVFQFNVDVIIAKSPIRRNLRTLMHFKVSNKMLFNLDNYSFQTLLFVVFFILFIISLIITKKRCKMLHCSRYDNK